MIKTISVAIWACLVMLASSYAMSYIHQQRAASKDGSASKILETRTTKEMNIPKITNGVVRGYIVTKFTYVVNSEKLHSISLSPEPFVDDEIIKYIYSDEEINPDHLDKMDLKKMTLSLVQNVNSRLKADVLTDMAVEEFTYMASAEAKPRQ